MPRPSSYRLVSQACADECTCSSDPDAINFLKFYSINKDGAFLLEFFQHRKTNYNHSSVACSDLRVLVAESRRAKSQLDQRADAKHNAD